MTAEETLNTIKQFYHSLNPAATDPTLMEAFKKNIEILTIEVSKQKMKENKKAEVIKC